MVANPTERTPIEGLVFDALVTVLGIVQDRRFTNFKPVLDVYIDKHFSSASVWNQLIRSMSMLLADKTSKQLRAAIKVWHYVFRFISRSRELQKKKDAGMGGTSSRLTEHLESSFKSGLARESLRALISLRQHTLRLTRSFCLCSLYSPAPRLQRAHEDDGAELDHRHPDHRS